MGLIERILGRKAERFLTAEEAEPFLRANGCDMETAGFPCIDRRGGHPLERYWANFENLSAKPV